MTAELTEELIVRTQGVAGYLTLNRPKAIHALTAAMVEAMTAALLAWRDDKAVEAVIVDHGEGRGFCSGGDINLLRQSVISDGGVTGRQFFYDEYRLNHLMFTCPKPIVAFIDGITMGGGVGIAQPARFRVATQNTRFAMPETGIGLFPDVGGGWYLSRLSGRLGQYLALTGARLDGAECLWAGLATHYLLPDELAGAKARIADGEPIAGVLDALAVASPDPKIAAHADAIARHFASDRARGDPRQSRRRPRRMGAGKTLATLGGKSPQTCKIALRQLAEAARLADFADNMALEYRIASRVLTRPDFREGVRAVIVDKTGDPAWDPATPEAVTPELIAAIFAPLAADEEWQPLAPFVATT